MGSIILYFLKNILFLLLLIFCPSMRPNSDLQWQRLQCCIFMSRQNSTTKKQVIHWGSVLSLSLILFNSYKVNPPRNTAYWLTILAHIRPLFHLHVQLTTSFLKTATLKSSSSTWCSRVYYKSFAPPSSCLSSTIFSKSFNITTSFQSKVPARFWFFVDFYSV